MRPSDEQDFRALCGTFSFFDLHKILFKSHQVAMLFDIRFQLVAGGAQSTPTTVPIITEHAVQENVVRLSSRHSDGGWPDPRPSPQTSEPLENTSSDIPKAYWEGPYSSLCIDDSEPVVQTHSSAGSSSIVLKSKLVLFVPSCLFISLL